MLLRLACLIYRRTLSKFFSQKLEYLIKFKNFNKSLKPSLLLNDYAVDLKTKKI